MPETLTVTELKSAIPWATDQGFVEITRKGETVAVMVGVKMWTALEAMLMMPGPKPILEGDLRIVHGGMRLRVQSEGEAEHILKALAAGNLRRQGVPLPSDRGIETFGEDGWARSCEDEDWQPARPPWPHPPHRQSEGTP